MGQAEDSRRRLLLLLEDHDRWDEMVWAMGAAVQRVVAAGRRNSAGYERERIVVSGVSVEDVVQGAITELFATDLGHIETVEALAVDIARKRAIDALRRAKVDSVTVTSLEASSELSGNFQWWDRLSYDHLDPGDRYELLHRVKRFWELAEAVLDKRELRILYEIVFLEKSRAGVGRGFDPPLTGAWIGRIFSDAARLLLRALLKDPLFDFDTDPRLKGKE